MYTIPPKKLLILNILDILKRYSDRNHRLSAKKIGEILRDEYSQDVDRKAIKRNLINLLDFGYDIEYSETVRTGKGGREEIIYSDWYLNRNFTDAELRLLIDSLLFSKHIPNKQCKDIIKKLEDLSSDYFHAKVRHIHNMPERLPENQQLFFTIEILDEAIQARKMVTFQYTEYGIDKKPHPREDENGEPREYEVSPYGMAATNGRYYLICNHRYTDSVSNYRVDRITKIRMSDEPAVPFKKLPGQAQGMDLHKHITEHIYMFAGESVRAKFRAKRYITGDILDWFGNDAVFSEADDEEVTVRVKVNENAIFYWAMQYGEHIEVLEPAASRERIKTAAKGIYERYCNQ